MLLITNCIFKVNLKREIGSPDFHLGNLQRVVMLPPGVPIDTVGVGGVVATQVLAIQIGRVTFAVPPGAVELCSTVPLIYVIILISSGKLVTVVPCAITSGKKNQSHQ